MKKMKNCRYYAKHCVGYNPSLQAFRAETMVDGLPRASRFVTFVLRKIDSTEKFFKSFSQNLYKDM